MSLINLSRAFVQMRRERDEAVGEYEFLTELIAGHIVDNCAGARTFLEVIAAEHRKAEQA